jgi:hypothetical protein
MSIISQPANSTALASRPTNQSSGRPTGSSASDPKAAILAEIERAAEEEAEADFQARKDELLAQKAELKKKEMANLEAWAVSQKAWFKEKITAEKSRELAALEKEVEMLGGSVKELASLGAGAGVIGPADEAMGEQLGLEGVGQLDEGRGADVMLQDDDAMEGVEGPRVVQVSNVFIVHELGAALTVSRIKLSRLLRQTSLPDASRPGPNGTSARMSTWTKTTRSRRRQSRSQVRRLSYPR